MNTPRYSVKTSPRARHVRFKVTPADGLCVVIPRGFDPSGIPDLVEKRRDWIDKALKDVAARAATIPADYLPERLELPAVGETWLIGYRDGNKRALLIPDSEHLQLTFTAANHSQSTVFNLLRRWLRTHARADLENQARSLAGGLGYKINKVNIRNQRTRWGSCSTNKTLSLNLKLLFLEPDQVRHVLVHELCHTMHLNHSPAFWQLVARYEPDYKAMNKRMKSAWQQVPRWV